MAKNNKGKERIIKILKNGIGKDLSQDLRERWNISKKDYFIKCICEYDDMSRKTLYKKSKGRVLDLIESLGDVEKKSSISKDLWQAKDKLKAALGENDSKEVVKATLEVMINDPSIMSQLTKHAFIMKDLLELSLWDKKLFRQYLDRMILEEERKLNDLKKDGKGRKGD